MADALWLEAEQAAWHRVKRRISQLRLYPLAQEVLTKGGQGRASGKGGKTASHTKHQVANLMNLALAAKNPQEIKHYLDHQAGRQDLAEFYGPLAKMFQEWQTTLAPQVEQEVLALIGSGKSAASTLLQLSRDRLLLDLFREFCQHLRAHHDYLDATQGGL